MSNLKHGYWDSPTYVSWEGMLQRCTNPKHDSYTHYGAKGIKVCNEWLDFCNFLADMGERPEGMTLDRIDRDRDYELANCRWATPKEQAANRSSTVFIEHNGQTKHLKQWADDLGLNYQTLYARFKKGWPIEQVLNPQLLRARRQAA